MALLNVMKVENWDDAARFSVTLNGYTPLRLGATIIGWVAHDLLETFHGDRDSKLSKVVMGRKAYELNLAGVYDACRQGLIDGPDVKWRSLFLKELDYSADIVLNLPAGALDVDPHGCISFTERTAAGLGASLSNYFRLREAHIQSELHKQAPARVMESLLSLHNNNYHWNYPRLMSWRGKELNDLIGPSRMMYMGQNADSESMSPMRSVSVTAIYFMDFLLYQALGREETVAPWKSLVEFERENVFFLKAASKEEQLLGEMLFDEEYLKAYLDEHNYKDEPGSKRIFFFAQADDILADWIIGTTITVSDLHELLRAKGLF